MGFNLKKRKIQELAPFSCYINVPKVWMEHHNLKKGDCISFEVDVNQNLILKPAKRADK